MKTIVVTPTYQERDNIQTFISEVLAAQDGIHVLIVDDNSPDGTGRIVQRLAETKSRVHVLIRKGPRGRGYADRAGLKWAVEQGFERILQMDADFSHDPKYIPDFLKAAQEADVVIGSRLIKGGGMEGRSGLRTVITYLANAYIRFLLRLPVKDCTTGYRCYRREALAGLDWDKFISPGPSLLEEILYAVCKNGRSVKEIPIIFYDRQKGRSKLTLKELLHIFVLIARFRFS